MAGQGVENRVRALARAAGFPLVHITSSEPLREEAERAVRWVEAGNQGEMRWITAERMTRSADPTQVVAGAQSVICVGFPYWARRHPAPPGHGRVARYAWGEDYHSELGARLERLAAGLAAEFGGGHRWYVDTGPLMDKALAARSGLGWYGKNTNILTERFGSWVLLGEVVTTLELKPDAPLAQDCGSCWLCLTACPTGALNEYSIDARRCISYLTIEHRGAIPLDLREKMGSWVFGCDICQDVCPPAMTPYLGENDHRQWAGQLRGVLGGQDMTAGRDRAHDLLRERRCESLDLVWLLRLEHAEYVELFRGTALRRAKVWMLRRNAAVALGNTGDETAVEPLVIAMRRDEHPVVRGHAAWALARIGIRLGLPVDSVLQEALADESDPGVRIELGQARSLLRGP